MSSALDRLADTNDPGIAPNAKRLLWAGFLAIFAAGIGAAIRGGILANWKDEFGFSGTQLGLITGAGFTGFCFGIIIGGVVVDKIGYGWLVATAFVLHLVSAFVTFGAHVGQSQETAYHYLFLGTFIFAIANGVLEGVANPLVATLFPNNRTHYLNILHASWPAGLVVGSLLGYLLGGSHSWQFQLGLYLIPTALYGIMFLGQSFPKSAAAARGLTFGDMMQDVGILGGLVACYLLSLFFGGLFKGFMENPDTAAYLGYGIGAVLLIAVAVVTRFSIGSLLLCFIFIIHAMVGAVELGTDGWIQNIVGNILTPDKGKIVFAFTSLCMFGLRFSAHFIEKNLRFSPISLLLTCALLACLGLNLVSAIVGFGGAIGAMVVYALGKTFFWPTMLAVIGDRFPRTGAIAMSISGGIGMLSAGLIGSAGLGYAKDRFSSETLAQNNPAVYADFKSEIPSTFLFFKPVLALDGKKVGAVDKKLADARLAVDQAGGNPETAVGQLSPSEQAVHESGIIGDRLTLRADSAIPLTMAVCYLVLLIYFKIAGGYKPLTIDPERVAGGIEGPMEA